MSILGSLKQNIENQNLNKQKQTSVKIQCETVRGSTLIETAHPGQAPQYHLHELLYDRRS